MKTLLYISISYVLIVGSISFGQQMPFSSHYYINMMTVNPALTGSGENTQAFLSHRSQFTGLNGGPQTSYLSLDGPTLSKKFGIGFTALNDVTSILARTNFMVNYAYSLKLGNESNLRFGLAAGIQNNRIDFDKAQVVDQNDVILYGPRQNQTVFNADFGLALNVKKLQFGFAIPQLLANEPIFTTNTGEDLIYSTKRHIRSTLKYEFVFGENGKNVFYPLVMIRAVKGAPVQYDINAVLDFKKRAWFGVTYHSNYAIAVSAGLRMDNFSIGYAHDFVLSKVANYSKRSSEIVLSYRFGEKDKAQQLINEELKKQMDLNNKKVNDNIDEIEALTEQTDSLKSELEKTNSKLNELSKNVNSTIDAQNAIKNELNNAQQQLKNAQLNNNQQQIQEVKPYEKPVLPTNEKVISGSKADFVDENGNEAQAGFYVVVGAFGVENNALNYKAECINSGITQTAILWNKTRGVREVYVYYTKERAEAVTEKLKYVVDHPKVWILKLD
ncbi:MAG: PorP/SprF family type IX secretion system membrane protein [Moraxellaceae bacterium]